MHHTFTSGLAKGAFVPLVLLSVCSCCQPFDLFKEKQGQPQSYKCHKGTNRLGDILEL